MKEHLIDSERDKQPLSQIIGQVLVNTGARGMELTKQLMTVMEQLQLPQSQGAQFGNTVFVNQYTNDYDMVMMIPMNIDTKENYIGNFEKMVRYFIKNGTKHVFLRYEDFATDKALTAIKKLKLGTITTAKSKGGVWEARIDLKAK